MDDSIEPHLADSLADALVEAEEALQIGHRPDEPLSRLVNLFAQANLKARWTTRSETLRSQDLQSSMWDDLHKALDAATASPAVVEAWVDWAEGEFLSQWERYESSDVQPQEVTIESVLGHQFLQSGVEHWLEALFELKETLPSGIDSASILAQAEAGQRLLVTVQVIEEERRNVQKSFIAAWMN